MKAEIIIYYFKTLNIHLVNNLFLLKYLKFFENVYGKKEIYSNKIDFELNEYMCNCNNRMKHFLNLKFLLTAEHFLEMKK